MGALDWEAMGAKRATIHMSVTSVRTLPDGTEERIRWRTADEAARAFGVSRDTVYRLIRCGGCTRSGVSFAAGRRTRKR